MGQSKSKPKKPNNAVDNLVYLEQKQKKKLIEDEKRRKRLEKQREKLEKKKLKQKKDAVKKKNKKNGTSNNSESNSSVATVNYKVAFRMEDYDNEVALKLDEQVAKIFAHFCLNQIVLGIQFFGNYQSEKSTGYERILRIEAEKNQNLDKHSILLPNALDESVQNRIQYKSKHGPDKNELTQLQLQTMYVIFENVEISKPDDANYDSINPICKVDIDTNIGNSKKYKGYLRLRLRETNSKTQSKHNFTKDSNKISESSIDSYFDSSIYNRDNNKNELKLPKDEPQYDTIKVTRDSNSSGIDVSGSEYAYITSLNTHQPLNELSVSKKLKLESFNSKVVPESCITVVEYYSDEAYVDGDNEVDKDNDDEDESNPSDSEADIIEIKYLNSKSFFCYFVTVLKDYLAQDLDLRDIEFDRATWKGASIFTKSYEIIPAIHVRCWPDCAFEWKRRIRSISRNPLNGQPLQWPTQEMIKKVESFGCHVIPMGYAPKTKKNIHRELEWKIVFPKAERFLESYLTDTQVKIFMISKILIKTFLEQKKDIFMFTMDHLRMHLFWECEKNYGAWPEEFLGEVLLRFLHSFLDRTRSKCLPDYFIISRNLFECIPESTLVRIHQIISQIVQNPVMHLIAAYRNLEQLEPFFPKLNYKKLYMIITVENPLNLLDQLDTCVRRNQTLIQMTADDNNDKKKDDYILGDKNGLNSDEEDEGVIGFSHKVERKRKSKKPKRLKSRERQQSIRKIINVKSIRKQSVDSIDLQQYVFSKNLDELKRVRIKNIPILDDIRRSLTVEMFIKQFIHQAKTSYDHKSLDKARIYLNQAGRLCTLMAKYGSEENANTFINKIEKMRSSFGSLSQAYIGSEHPPALPERTSLEPVKSFRLGDRPNLSPVVTLRKQPNDIYVTDSTQRNEKVRSVHFNVANSFEPRSFSYEADVHTPNILRINSRDDSKQNKLKNNTHNEAGSNKISKINSFNKLNLAEKHVTIETKPVTIKLSNSIKSKDKIKKQVSMEENTPRKSILRVTNKEISTEKTSNNIQKQFSNNSNSSPNELKNKSVKYHPDVSDNQSKDSSVSSVSTTSEIEENTEGLPYKEIFERRKNLIHRKLVSSLIIQQNEYYSSSDSDHDYGNSTDL